MAGKSIKSLKNYRLQHLFLKTISDTATSLISGPKAIIDKIADQAGAKFDKASGLYMLKCKAKILDFNLIIGDEDHDVDNSNMIIPIDKENCGPIITYEPLSSATYFQFKLNSVSSGSYVNKKGWQASPILTGENNVVSDTGTSMIAAPFDVVEKVAVNAGANFDRTSGYFTLDCDAQIDSFNQSIGGQRGNFSITRVVNGSALVLKWNCERCDGPQTWSSQPKLKGRFFEGNIKLVCSAHTTALPISRLLDFGHELGLALPAERTMRDYLSKLVIPAVNTIYCNHMRMVQSTVRNTMSGGGLDISMDGRYDSPGFSATNCTVSAVDLSSNLVIMIVNKNKEEKGIENVSGRMEKEGVKEGVRRIHAMQLKIRSICTDNDAKIGKMLREDPVFKGIKHLLDFWHLIKGINHDLRELSKKKSCPNIHHWRNKIINHAYYCHYKYGRDRTLCMNYWIAALPHVTGKHRGFRKIPFLKGIRKCKHAALGKDNMHLIKRDSEEYQELKAVIMKPTFLSGLLRASPKTNTSPNESYNSIINMYAPKSRACSPKWYEERVKLATMHFNNLALLSLLNLREERWNTSVNVIGRQANAVKRKMTKAVHEWRNEVVSDTGTSMIAAPFDVVEKVAVNAGANFDRTSGYFTLDCDAQIDSFNLIIGSHEYSIESENMIIHGGGLDISMDGRYDSPGFSATNCTVSAVDLSSNLVIMIVNKNKEEKGIENVSGRMEKEGVKEGVRRIHAMQLKIRSICTDNDAKIGKMLREDPVFKGIKHLLDFWHLIKGINHDLRELSKKKSCPNIHHWRNKIINHAYYCHYKYGRDRTLCMNYWIAALPHVTGKHRGFRKIPFLKGIRKCKHAALGKDNMHLIKRDSEEYQELKAVIMKPTFLSGLLRASPKTNTSPNESYNSIINMYAPKSRACSPKWYEERVKLATMHFNNLALLSLLNLREERWNTSVNVIGRQANAVKRKMTKAVHEWRNEVWKEVPCVLEGRLVEQFLRKNQAPTDREYILALQQEEEEAVSDEEGGEGDGDGEDGGDSDASMELGGGVYGEEVDSDREPTMKLIELSDVEDQKSEGEDEEDEEELSSGSEWDEGEAGRMALERGRMRRGRGRGLSRGGTVAQSVVTTDKSTVLTRVPANQEEEEPSTEEGKGEKREKRKVRLEKKARKVVMDESSSESEREKPPLLGLGSMRFADHSWKDNELEQSDRDDWKTHGHVAHETHDLAMRCEWNETHPMGNKFIVEHTRIRFNLDPIDENNLQTSAMKTRLSEFATLRSVSSSENFTISSVSSRICTVGWLV
ncbi:hypothetical protein PRIPAC_78128 [Pristionchus pacificus]|uniref:Uncharacterized protein n=1 Tax=Pristionchus pacificus TaxID=54126 RepID=A0A2A6CMV4_PRIPA|nr:hypothetical protein PRIPAC_78128 [Pristionchus pacificus]|eukprot:PDM79430.1 hypothetical protein PRIPAC_32009 [Pristionchus pacificus]